MVKNMFCITGQNKKKTDGSLIIYHFIKRDFVKIIVL